MASTWSALKIELLETGQNSGTWGTSTNVNLGDAILGEAITGQATVDFASDADVTITLTDSATSQAARNLRLNITESSTGVGSVRNLILGSGCQIEKFYLVNNTGTGAKTIKNTSGTGVSVPAGKATLVFNNGTNVVDAASYFSSLTLGAALPVASGGTSLTTLTANNVILGNGTSAPLFVAPSSSGNVLTSNGSTWASSAPAAGGITYTTVKTANYTAVANDGVQTNTTSGAFTVTLPATPSNGNQVFVVDSFNTWGTNNLTIGRNGSTIEGVAQDLVCDITGVSVQCVYNGTTWDIYAQVGGAGGSVVSGPASSTANGVALFDGTTGKLLKNSSATDGLIHGLTVGRGAGAVSTNTVLGASAFQANTTGSTSVVVGNQAGYTNSTGINSVFVGHQAGYYATGNGNSFFGTGAGGAITTGIRNTIIGQYDGNGDGLDIRTASDYAVISDGAGNRLLSTANGYSLALDGGAVPQSGTGITFPATQSASTDANTLDDYEEGTYTITLTPGGSGSITLKTGFTSMSYTRVGRVVTITGNPRIQSVSSPTGRILLTLPFPVRNGTATTSRAGSSIAYYDNSNGPLYFFSIPCQADEATTVLNIQVSAFSPAAVVPAADDELYVSYTYFTD